MTTAMYLQEQMPIVQQIIRKAEGRILEVTGIVMVLDVKDVDDLNVADNQMLHLVLKCCKIWEVPYSEIQAKDRKVKTVVKRKVLAWLLHTHYNRKVSQKRMAHLIGVSDHSSFLFNMKTAKNLYDTDDVIFLKYYLPVKHLFDEGEINK